mgnify:FL=1
MRVGYLAIDRPPACSLAELLAPLTPALQVDPEGHGVWFDAGGVRLLYGSEEQYGRAILAAVTCAGGAGRIGIARAPWIAAVAARLAAAGEVIVVPEPETRTFLRPLPLAWLPLPRRIQERLRALGITTIGQFADLPPASVRQRFGAEALRAHRLACGDDPTPFRGQAPSEPLRFTCTLEPPAMTQDGLVAALETLCERAARALAFLGHAAWRLAVAFVDERGHAEVRSRRFPRPLRTAQDLAPAARALAARLSLAQPIASLHLILEEHDAVPAFQPTLLGEATLARQAEHERLRHRVERQAPGRVVRLLEYCPAAPLPELRWRVAGAEHLHPLAGEPVRLHRHASGWWLDGAGRRMRIVRGGHWERIDLWWPEERHRWVFWVELADGQRLLLRWETSDRTWRLVGRID